MAPGTHPGDEPLDGLHKLLQPHGCKRSGSSNEGIAGRCGHSWCSADRSSSITCDAYNLPAQGPGGSPGGGHSGIGPQHSFFSFARGEHRVIGGVGRPGRTASRCPTLATSKPVASALTGGSPRDPDAAAVARL